MAPGPRGWGSTCWSSSSSSYASRPARSSILPSILEQKVLVTTIPHQSQELLLQPRSARQGSRLRESHGPKPRSYRAPSRRAPTIVAGGHPGISGSGGSSQSIPVRGRHASGTSTHGSTFSSRARAISSSGHTSGRLPIVTTSPVASTSRPHRRDAVEIRDSLKGILVDRACWH